MYNSILHEWFEEVWNRGNREAVHRLLPADAVIHDLAQDGSDSRGPDEFLAFFQKFRDAFPDMRVTVHEVANQGDIQAVRFTVTATHTGNSLGFAATGRQVTFGGMSMVRLRDGQAVEAWNTWSALSLYNQLGFTIAAPQ